MPDNMEELGIMPEDGEGHTIPTRNLTKEEAKQELDQFLTYPKIAEEIPNFEMQEPLKDNFEESPEARERRRELEKLAKDEWAPRREEAIQEAKSFVAEGLEFSPTHASILVTIKSNLQAAMDNLELLKQQLNQEAKSWERLGQDTSLTKTLLGESVTIDE